MIEFFERSEDLHDGKQPKFRETDDALQPSIFNYPITMACTVRMIGSSGLKWFAVSMTVVGAVIGTSRDRLMYWTICPQLFGHLQG